MFKSIDLKDIDHLKTLVAPNRVITELPEGLNVDEMPIYGKGNAEVLVLAETPQEVAAVLRYAFDQHIAVTPRGSGTSLVGSSVALFGGIVLSSARMNKIRSIDPQTLRAVVEPGVLLMTLAAEVEAKGLLYAPDPGEKSATLGGNVATNAGGMRAVKYGVTRDHVLAIEAVLADGTIINTGSAVSKDSSGYDLKDLLIGSEGTLAFMTAVTVKLLPKPKYTISLVVPFDDIDLALQAVPELMQLPELPVTLEFMEKEVLDDAKEYLGKDFADRNWPAYLIITYSAAVKSALEHLLDMASDRLKTLGAKDVLLSDTSDRLQAMWATRGAFLEAIKNSTPEMDEIDVCLPITTIAGYLKEVKELSRSSGVRIRSFGHAGDGNLHIYLCKDQLSDDDWHSILPKLLNALYTRAFELGGVVSGEHGIGHAKKAYLNQALGEKPIALMKGIKHVFDPTGILNPGKILD